jgi:sensor histidine kinase YesM
LDEEIQIVKSYLEIEQIRYGNRLKYSVNVEGPAARAKVPGLIIQPLVENSIKHGLRSKVEGGSVAVSVVVDDHTCRVCVRDTGVGFSKGDTGDGLGHGMRSIRERLELAFPKRWKMDIQSSHGTQIDIEFPMEVRTCVIAR